MNLKVYIFSIISLILISCDPFHTEIENQEVQIITYESNSLINALSIDSTLNIMTWNIKFGGGRIDMFFDCHGERVLMTYQEVEKNMKAIVEYINYMNPDVIFIQEADIDAKRSAYFDQIQYILDQTKLNYGVYASQWQADYVPNQGIGQMNSGNAILSKYPMTNTERIMLPLIEEDGKLVQYFYLRRNLMLADIKVKGKEITILNTHTEAYSSDGTKKAQLELIKDKIDEINAAGKQFVLGGDFNNLPPNSSKYCEFDDDACEQGSGFETLSCETLLEELETMKIYTAYNQAIPQATYLANESKYYSFTSDKNGFWNRKLDYIFTNGNFVEGSGMVHQDVSTGGWATMPLSDHAPVSALYIIK